MHDVVVAYALMVRMLAKRHRRSGVEQEDLIQIGMVGLIQAVSTFDPDRGVKLSTYAYHHASGQIRHYLRDDASLVRIPRRVQHLRAAIARLQHRLAQDAGQWPLSFEVAKRLEVSVRDVEEARSVGCIRHFAEFPDEAGPAAFVEQHDRLEVEDRGLIREAIRTLPPVQRRVVYHLFYQDLSQHEVARILGVSQRHVSRLMTLALRALAGSVSAAGFAPASRTTA